MNVTVREYRRSRVVTEPLGRDDVHCWLVDQDEPDGTDASVLSPEELRAGARLQRGSDRAAYRTRHVAARVVLGAYLGREPRDVAIVREPCRHCGASAHGKPVLSEASLHFSLSARGRRSVLAVARRPVGVDVEEASVDLTDIAASVLHPRETQEFASLTSAALRRGALVRLWCRKEALLKMSGEGLGGGVSHLHVGLGSRPPSSLPSRWTDLAIDDRHVGAVALLTTEDIA